MNADELAAWRAGVLEHVAEADRGARELAELLERAARRDAGRCVGCGCGYEQRTAGCRTCTTRFSVRRWVDRRDALGRRAGASASSRALTEQAEP